LIAKIYLSNALILGTGFLDKNFFAAAAPRNHPHSGARRIRRVIPGTLIIQASFAISPLLSNEQSRPAMKIRVVFRHWKAG
jgi:hypothetical protein